MTESSYVWFLPCRLADGFPALQGRMTTYGLVEKNAYNGRFPYLVSHKKNSFFVISFHSYKNFEFFRASSVDYLKSTDDTAVTLIANSERIFPFGPYVSSTDRNNAKSGE